MTGPQSREAAVATASREEIMSALFASMVVQKTNMALMLLGKMPHPEAGETVRDIDGAKMFIDQLEMLEFKTKGNLAAREDKLLKQSLTALRMAFVEAIDAQPGGRASASPPSSGGAGTAAPDAAKTPPSGQPAGSPAAEAARKKFSQEYLSDRQHLFEPPPCPGH